VVESHSVLAQEVVKRNLMSVKELSFPVSFVSSHYEQSFLINETSAIGWLLGAHPSLVFRPAIENPRQLSFTL
jgi:hypothetical protein